ncbi:MAG: hypothetical protein WC875_03070 [Candidatus Absconditabacterales bacterium]
MDKQSLYKIIGLLSIIAGEFLSIYGEMLGSKYGRGNSSFLIKPAILMVAGGLVLLVGYMLAYSGFKNIRIVSVVSITAILILEPILAWTLFHEIPTKGSIIGFIFGAMGMLATIFL